MLGRFFVVLMLERICMIVDRILLISIRIVGDGG